ncbi:MAG: heme-binding protein [Gemmataceae bacterium]|nr:heme-binding protein [Gemmataceae bacterium]
MKQQLRVEELEPRQTPALLTGTSAGTAWVPLLGDWNGDHTDTVGTFDPTTATWYLRNDNSPGAPDAAAPFQYGAPGWVPLAGDWDGDGTDGIGVFDPATATFYLKNTVGPGAPDFAPFAYGVPGWWPVAGDWDGDGLDSIGVFDPATATWYLRNANDPGAPDITPFAYGAPGWRPVVGDWDGDGRVTVGVVQPGNATWYPRNDNSPGAPDAAAPFAYGGVGWFYLAGSFTGAPPSGIAAVDHAQAVWYLRNSTSPGAPDVPPFAYGTGGTNPDETFLTALAVGSGASALPILAAGEVQTILSRAAAATASDDGIIAIVDRGGQVLGVRLEGGVAPEITSDNLTLTFAVDGALAKARTAAFFANDTAPLTSRTVQFISQSTITEREVNSNPNVPDPNSPLRGPGYVAPIGLGGHFPPNVPFTPSADLFAIEHTNRDSIIHPGADHLKGTADDSLLPSRFNVPPAFIPAGKQLTPPESYGFISGLFPTAQARGIGTLPGGIPIYKNGALVGGIGVFFPGTTGFATEENSRLSVTFNPGRPDRSLEAEFIATAAVGGSSSAGARVGTLGGLDAPAGFDIPFGRIDLVGITLDTIGPGGTQGPANLVQAAGAFGIGQGNPNSGRNLPLDPGGVVFLRDGQPVPEGWLVLPHDGAGISADEVTRIVQQGISQATQVRAQIRLPLGNRTRMVFAVADSTGQVLGLFRMPDATVFSIDVAVAKARNVAYYDDPAQLVAVDQIAGVPAGTSFTNRTFRYVAQPRFPEGIDGRPPGPFSILNDPGINPQTGLNTGAPLPASVYQSVLGFDSFNPGTNFRAPTDPRNQNGVVFFPGSSGVYKNVSGGRVIVGGFGVSGDGVDQDDVVTASGISGFEPPPNLRADQVFVNGVRLPYQKFPRNPLG